MEKRCLGCMRLKTQEPVCEHCGFNENIPNLPHQLPLGTVLRGQYLVGKVLGQGGFGITYMGWDLNLDMPIAIKEYFPAGCVNRETTVSLSVTANGSDMTVQFCKNRERFLQEARVLAKLREIPGIVRVQNFFEDNNTAYIIMEYVNGVDLKRCMNLRERRFTMQELLVILRPVMKVLDRIHAAGIVHRDISPDNIMLLPDGTAKLLDFGAVREVVDADTERGLPQSTEAILKHGFAPMEQYQKRGSLGPWTDIYALCATIYFCLTGEVPADAPARMLEDIQMNWQEIPGLTEKQIQALDKGMQIRPHDRISSVRELCAALYGEEDAANMFTAVNTNSYYDTVTGGVTVPVIPEDNKTTVIERDSKTASEKENRTIPVTPEREPGTEKQPESGNSSGKKPSMFLAGGVAVAALFACALLVPKLSAPKETVPAETILAATVETTIETTVETTVETEPPRIVVDSGSCGETLSWTLYEDGEIRISGEGIMTNFQTEKEVPWYPYAAQIRKLVIEEGVTGIGGHSFFNCTNLTEIIFADTVTDIRGYAFARCTSLESVVIPDSVVSMGGYMFQRCTALRSAVLPANMTALAGFSFNLCDKLEEVTLPGKLTSIGGFAFNGCSSLKNVYFRGTEEDWANITIKGKNFYLTAAERHYEF